MSCTTNSCSLNDYEYISGLRYARMIQRSLMPEPTAMEKILNEYFVLNLPKDIVTGDFFYVHQKDKYTYLAVGDCTGHGVPGALLSILGISFLNEIIQSIASPHANRILNTMREKVMKALHQTGQVYETKDSIDMALCIIDQEQQTLQYAGANRPLLVIRNGQLSIYPPDKMPIGVAPIIERAFSATEIELRSNDLIYLFTDGYADQFGGPANKKFKYRRFREHLVSIQHLPMQEQYSRLTSIFNEWKGEASQIDDVLVMGIKI